MSRTHRLSRWVVNAATLTSLVLCLATLALWSRSYSWSDSYVGDWPGNGWGVGSSAGRIALNVRLTDGWYERSDRPAAGWRMVNPRLRWSDGEISWFDPDPLPVHGFWRNFGPRPGPVLDLGRTHVPPSYWPIWDGYLPVGPRPTDGERYLRLVVTHAIVASGAGLLPVIRLIRTGRGWRMARRRRRRGLRGACGYDLRATPNRCPECGRVPEIGSAARPVPVQAPSRVTIL